MYKLLLFLIGLLNINSYPVTRPFKCPTSKTPGWHPIGFSHKITTKPQRVEFNNEDGGFKALVVWRTPSGEVLARPDVCPHLGAKLSKGTVLEDGSLQCPYHGVKCGPETSCDETREMYGICYEANGLTWWNNNKNEDYYKFCEDLNILPNRKDTTVTRWEMEVKASFSDCFRNGMDLHHAGWLHSSTFGNKFKDPDDVNILWLDNRTMRADFNYYSNDKYQKVTGEKTFNYHLFQSPSTTWNKVFNGDKSNFVFIHLAMRPTSPTSTQWYLTGASNYVPSILPDAFSQFILERITKQVALLEDRPQLESMETENNKLKFSYKINLPLDDIYNNWYNGPPCDFSNEMLTSNNHMYFKDKIDEKLLSDESPLKIKLKNKNLEVPDKGSIVHYFRHKLFKKNSIEDKIEKSFISEKMLKFFNNNKDDFKSKLFNEFVTERTEYIDKYIETKVNNGEIKNLVILGSGGDSRAHRLECLKKIKIWEVDIPNIIKIKRTIVDEYCPNCNNVNYIECDLDKEYPDNLPTEDTLVLCEGLLFHINNESVERILKNSNNFLGDFMITKPPTEEFSTIITNPKEYVESLGFEEVESNKIKGLFGTTIVSGKKNKIN